MKYKLCLFWPPMIQTKLQEFLTEADLDGDGNVNYEEFVMLIFKVMFLRKLNHTILTLNIYSLQKSHFQDKIHEKQPNGWPSHLDVDKPTDV